MHFFFFRSTPAKSLQSKTEDPFFSTEGENRFLKQEATQPKLVGHNPFFTPAQGKSGVSGLQTKLKVGSVNDPQEREADRMAEQVVKQSVPPSLLQAKCTECEQSDTNSEEERNSVVQEKAAGVQTKPIFESKTGDEVQTKPDMLVGKSLTANAGLSQQLRNSKGSGEPLQENTRADMEEALDADFSGVRIHTDAEAEQMNQGLHAKAFTHGQDIYFNQGQYNPSAEDGTKLLAHELTHVVQQNGAYGGRDHLRRQIEMQEPPRPGPEDLREAISDMYGDRILEILRANAKDEHMKALLASFDSRIFHTLREILSLSQMARARAYLGRHLPLVENIYSRKSVTGDDENGVNNLLRTAPVEQIKELANNQSKLDEVKLALQSFLNGEEYYTAMRILIKRLGAFRQPFDLYGNADPDQLEGLNPFTLDPAFLEGKGINLNIDLGIDQPVSISKEKVELAWMRIKEEDESTYFFTDESKRPGKAYLAFTDLNFVERRWLWVSYLKNHNWQSYTAETIGKFQRLCQEKNDAVVISQAMKWSVEIDAADEVGMSVAAENAGRIYREKKVALANLAEGASEEREKLEKEIKDLEQLFFDPQFVEDLEYASADHLQILEAMGWGQTKLAIARLVKATEFEEFLQIFKSLSDEDRLYITSPLSALDPFSEEARIQAKIKSFESDQQEVIQAYAQLNNTIQFVFPGQPTNETVITLYKLKKAHQNDQTDRVYSILYRLTKAQKINLGKYTRFGEFQQELEANGDLVLKGWLDRVAEGKELPANLFKRRALLVTQPDTIGNVDAYMEWSAIELKGRHGELRRGYVAHKMLQNNPNAVVSERDRALAREYAKIEKYLESVDQGEKAQIQNVIFGQPQLMDTEEGALDTDLEAEFMYQQLLEKLDIEPDSIDMRPDRTQITDIFDWAGPNLDEAAATFFFQYKQLKAGGFTQQELWVLSKLYHDALAQLQEFEEANRMVADVAAMVSAVVVSAVVTALTGGAGSPLLVAALSGTLSGTASLAVGATIRQFSSGEDLATDFASGFVEGAVSVAGASLSAKAVKGLQMAGKGARATARVAGSTAVKNASSRLSYKVVEGIIDGFIGGVSGELFETAIDEATWNQEVSKIFSTFLAAMARGAVFGVAGGAAGALAGEGLGRLAKWIKEIDIPPSELAKMSDEGQRALAKAFDLAESGDLESAYRTLKSIKDVSPASMQKVESSLRNLSLRRAALDIEGGQELLRNAVIKEVDDAAFAKLAGGARGNAVIRFEGGEAVVFIRKGTDPSLAREELIHLAQWHQSHAMRARIELLTEEKLANWSSLDIQERIPILKAKFEVEADAQRRIINQLSDEATEGDPEGLRQLLDAEETLSYLNSRLKKLNDALHDSANLDPELTKWIQGQEPPRLFSKGASPGGSTEPQKAANWNKVKSLVGKDPALHEDELRKLGYILSRDKNGKIIKISRKHATNQYAALSLENGVIKEGRRPASFAERRAAAAFEFETARDDIAKIRQDIASGKLSGDEIAKLQGELKAMAPDWFDAIAKKGLAPEDAGLLMKWGRTVETLQSKRIVSIQELLAGFESPIKESALKAFRRKIRKNSADYLVGITDGKSRMKAMNELLALQPDNRSKGELYTAFRQGFLKKAGGWDVEDIPPSALEIPGARTQSGTRTPDATASLMDPVEDFLPPGRYAIEDKAGPGAFKLDQAEDYAASYSAVAERYTHGDVGEKAGGIITNPGAGKAEFDGILYTFTSKAEADAALSSIIESGNDTLKNRMGKHPGGIHLAYFDAKGKLQLLTPVPN